MLKKAILASGLLAVTSAAVGLPVISYARTGFSMIRQSAGDTMPLEWELKRARQMITDLAPEITNGSRQIALEKVEVARLETQLTDNEEKLAKSRVDIERLTDDLNVESPVYSYAGHTYTSVQVKTDLSNRFKRHKTRQATADKLQQMLDARRSSLESAHERMEAMLSSRRQLEVEVENLQARLGSLRVSQTASQLNLDDSQLSKTRELLDNIGARIDVEEQTMHIDTEYFGEIDLDETEETNLMDEISSYFGSDSKDEKSLVAIQLD
jgi:hypothetical protein